jgi:hypothetical protein
MYPFPLAGEILCTPLPRYPWIPGPWTYFALKSPAETRYFGSDHSLKWQEPATEG